MRIISSPPPVYNFAEIPQVEGKDQYWITKSRQRAAGEAVEPEPHVDPSTIHMPSPSYWPIWIALGAVLMAGGIVSHYAVSFIGGGITVLGIIGWGNEPATAPDARHAGH